MIHFPNTYIGINGRDICSDCLINDDQLKQNKGTEDIELNDKL